MMGSKKLKGMVVTGDGEVEIPDKDRFEAVKKEITRKLQTITGKYGQISGVGMKPLLTFK